MRKTTMVVATVALTAMLAACGTEGGTTATDRTKDEPTGASSGRVPSDDGEGDAQEGGADQTDTGDTNEASDESEHAAARDDAEKDGRTVLTGTVRIIDGPDIFEYEGVDAEVLGGRDSEAGNTYAILELDEETAVSGMGADGSPRSDEKVDHVGLGSDMPRYEDVEDTASQWREYEGKRVCVAGDVWFPTDVSFPLSGRMSNAEVLYEE